MHLKNNLYKSWVEIYKDDLLSNFRVFQKIVDKNTKIAAVVKANAYGHGLKEVVSILKGKADVFAVDCIDEALQVRKIDKKAVVVILGYTTNSNILRAIKENISLVIYNIDSLKKITSLNFNRKAKVHIKIETGLNRQGVKMIELIRILDFIERHRDQIFLEGISTHFANIEDTLDPSFAMKQLETFRKAINIVKQKGFDPPLVHCAASAGTLLHKDSHFSMVRIGIGLYGLWPSEETKRYLLLQKKRILLKPILTWKSIIAQVKDVDVGESVGYGRTWFAPRKSKIAIVPVGYSDGFDRKLSNIGKVIINRHYAKVIGRVAMDMVMVDVTDCDDVKLEDEVILIGEIGELKVSADEIASKIDTINYEVVSRINPLLPRIVI